MDSVDTLDKQAYAKKNGPEQLRRCLGPVLRCLIAGAPRKIRTYDLRIRSPLLYPAELGVHPENDSGLGAIAQPRAGQPSSHLAGTPSMSSCSTLSAPPRSRRTRTLPRPSSTAAPQCAARSC